MNNKFKQFLINEGFVKQEKRQIVETPVVHNEKFTRFLIREGFRVEEEVDEGIFQNAADTAKHWGAMGKDFAHQTAQGIPASLGSKKAAKAYDADYSVVLHVNNALQEWEDNGGPTVQHYNLRGVASTQGERVAIQALQKLQKIIKSDTKHQYAQPASAFLAAADKRNHGYTQDQDPGAGTSGAGSDLKMEMDKTVQALEAVYGKSQAYDISKDKSFAGSGNPTRARERGATPGIKGYSTNYNNDRTDE